MLTFDETQAELTEIANKIPDEIFKGLNGGVVLVPDIKHHPKALNNDLLILGEYHCEPNGFGRYITIYYGSFCKAHSNLSRSAQIKKLADLLHHELVHHLENLAGDQSLEIQDAIDIAKFRET